jgi:hypothetical protein
MLRKELGIVGNFKTDYMNKDPRSGLRDYSIPFGFSHHLQEYFDIKCYDVSSMEPENCGIRRLVSTECPKNLFIVQNHVDFIIDVPERNIFYLHIDGTQSVHPNQITFAFYIFNALGKHFYKVNERQLILLPFADMSSFNPNREKDIHFSNIPRGVSFEEYKDVLERSKFTLVSAYYGISKRVPEAFACKTIPIVMTNEPEMQRRYCKDHVIVISYDGEPHQHAEDYTEERVNKAYEFLKENHSLKQRIKKMLPYLNKYTE